MKFEKIKCHKCGDKFAETSIAFHRRSRDIFNVLPPICPECNRIERALNPTSKDLKRQNRREKIREIKQRLKKFHLIDKRLTNAILKGEKLSIPYLQSKFRLSYDGAKRILEDLNEKTT